MTYEDFMREFRTITIAEINDDASYVYKSTKDPDNKGVFYKLDILQAGTYSLHVDKTPERSYPDKIQDQFRYPNSELHIGKNVEGSIENAKASQSSRRTLYKGFSLDPGSYIVKVKIDYDGKFEKDYDVNLAVYAEFPCQLSWASQDQATALDPDS